MRLRNIPGSREKIAENRFCVQEPEQWKGKWKEFFGNDHPLYLEIGMGKGRFLMDMAEKYPENNYIGIEMYSSVLVRALEKAEERYESAEKTNFAFLRFDARLLDTVFGEREVDGIYLNFSDPWPKDRHAKRRLTSPVFLGQYEKVLKEGAGIRFKTDNTDLFDWSEETLRERNWKITALTRDLHADEQLSKGNIMTEYEEKFSGLGQKICMLAACPPEICKGE